MIIVVEIASRTGGRACKEYDAPSINAAVEAARRELRAYPTFRSADIWMKRKSAGFARTIGRVVMWDPLGTACGSALCQLTDSGASPG